MDSITNNQQIPGLLRNRSAPSSLLSNFVENGVVNSKQLDQVKPEDCWSFGQGNNIGLPPHYPRQNSSSTRSSGSGTKRSYGSIASIGSSQNQRQKRFLDLNSSLSRQNSSPPGLFGPLSVQQGNGVIRGIGSYAEQSSSSGEASLGLRSQLSFPSRLPSTLGVLSQISEVDNESIEADCQANLDCWNGYHSVDVNAFKTDLDNSENLFSKNQKRELENRVQLLSHHLSLPKTSAEISAMEKLLQFRDSVPCRIRAKRGCATHPRSIAERVRRTKISDRIKKLQELVPSMDKQTSTSEMLDLAIDYIKSLQTQYKILGDQRAKCRCPHVRKQVQN